MSPKEKDSVVIVRGSFRGLDPTYACVSHNGSPSNFGILHFTDGLLTKREIIPRSEQKRVEAYTVKNTFRGAVYVDDRTSKDLLPLKTGPHCTRLDISTFRRSKSDEEIDALTKLYRSTRRLLADSNPNEKAFRGASRQGSEDLKAAFVRTDRKGFVQFRGGLKDSQGRLSDLTRVEPKTKEWEARLDRVYKGLDAVMANATVGTPIKDLNDCLWKHLDPTKDVVYGDAVHHTGFESQEFSIPLTTIQQHDFLKAGVAVGDLSSGEVAVVFRGAFPVTKVVEEKTIKTFRGTKIEHTPDARKAQILKNANHVGSLVNEYMSAGENPKIAGQNVASEIIGNSNYRGLTFDSAVKSIMDRFKGSSAHASSTRALPPHREQNSFSSEDHTWREKLRGC